MAQVTPVGTPASGKQTNTIASFTVPAGNKRLLLVTASDGSSTNITGVTFNGVPMVERIEVTDGFIATDAIYTLSLGDGATAITGSIVFTSAGGANATRFISAAAFTKVNQTNPFSDIKSDFGNVSSSSLNVTSSAGDLVYDIFDTWVDPAVGSQVQTSGQTVVSSSGALAFGAGMGYGYYSTSKKAGAPTVTTSWNAAGQMAEIHIAVNITQDNTVLPIKLLSFTAQPKNNDIILSWLTANEINFDHIETERSCNGTDFSLAAKCMNTVKEYTDVNAVKLCANNDNIFYRLKMIDQNGSYTYSPVVSVNVSKKASVVTDIMPMLSSGKIAISFNMPQRGVVALILTNMAGQVIRTMQINANKGNSVQYIDGLLSLPAGVYALKLAYGQDIVTKKLIK